MDNVEMYFFSGTGNSLFLVKELAKRLPQTNLIPIASRMSEKEIVPQSKVIGFCFPNYGGHLPIIMKRFMKKMRFSGDEYIFAIFSSGGSRCNAFEDVDRVLAKSGKKLDARFIAIMPCNNPKADKDYRILTEEEFDEYEVRARKKIDLVADIVGNKEQYKDIDEAQYVFPFWMEKILIPLLLAICEEYPSIITKGFFYADSKCVGCGLCGKVCLGNRIRVEDRRPSWDDRILCFSCYACLNYCPKEAIQVTPRRIYGGSWTTVNGRYLGPFDHAASQPGSNRLTTSSIRSSSASGVAGLRPVM